MKESLIKLWDLEKSFKNYDHKRKRFECTQCNHRDFYLGAFCINCGADNKHKKYKIK